MMDRPAVSDEDLIRCAKEAYGVELVAIAFLPIGNDPDAGAFRAEGPQGEYFVKVKKGGFNLSGVLASRYLRSMGIDAVAAPCATVTGAPWGVVMGFGLLLFPFIVVAPEAALTKEQWVAFGGVLRQVHSVSSQHLSLRRENFAPLEECASIIRRARAAVPDPHQTPQAELIRLLNDKGDEIDTMLRRAEALAARLRRGSSAEVICHGDLHLGNVLLDAQEKIHLVDWDQTLLAPIERDLVFVTDGAFGTTLDEERSFSEGYGQVHFDPCVMAYYRYVRAIEDLSGFSNEIMFTDTSNASKTDSLRWARNLFRIPGLVTAAHRLGDALL